MVFSSNFFLIYFLPIFLLLYFLVGKRFRNLVLLFASLFFFSWGAPRFVFLLLGTTAIDFYLIRWMSRQENQQQKKRILIASLVLNLGLLAVFKYANFFVENINSLLGSMGADSLSWTAIVVPIGISFFVFESITYAVDVYRGNQEPLKRFFDYLLYIVLFPKLIVGPIIPYRTIAHQIRNRESTVDDRLNGFYRFCIGMCKKVLIADQIGSYTYGIFQSDFSMLDSYTAWVGLLAFAFQLYFDFSGYSDMAIGLARILGFTIPENFNKPFISASVTEFWTRWHMSLGNWMKEYLYIPLGGNRVSKGRLYFNLGLVFVLSGLWHGASWNFLIWGIWHGSFMILERLFLLNLYKRIGKIPGILITFSMVVIGCIFFRIHDTEQAFAYLDRLFSNDGIAAEWFDGKFYFFLLLAAVLSFIGLADIKRMLENLVFADRKTNIGHVVFTGLSLIVLLLASSYIVAENYHPFIYFQF